MLETGTKERSWRKVVSEVGGSSCKDSFQSFFTADALPGCQPAELAFYLDDHPRWTNNSASSGWRQAFLHSLFRSNSARIMFEYSACDGIWVFRSEDALDEPVGLLSSAQVRT